VVPKGAARIRTQISAAHDQRDLDFAIEKISEAKKELGI
jgi:glycine C-acetyltransferase